MIYFLFVIFLLIASVSWGYASEQGDVQFWEIISRDKMQNPTFAANALHGISTNLIEITFWLFKFAEKWMSVGLLYVVSK